MFEADQVYHGSDDLVCLDMPSMLYVAIAVFFTTT